MQILPRVQRHKIPAKIVRIPLEVPWKVGRVTEVSNDLGALLVARGWADEVKPKKAERAVRKPPEVRGNVEPKEAGGVPRRRIRRED